MILEVRQIGDPILRRVAADVDEVTPEVRKLLDDMVETMVAEHGVGLAAPQIGISRRIAVIGLDGVTYRMVNPEIVQSEGEQLSHEACLSVPDLAGDVLRAMRIGLNYLDENGEPQELKTQGLLSRIVQHELDHLYGVLFVDRLQELKLAVLPSELQAIEPATNLEQLSPPPSLSP